MLENYFEGKRLSEVAVRTYLKGGFDTWIARQLWTTFAELGIIDYTMPEHIIRRIQVEVFEAGVLPFTNDDLQECFRLQMLAKKN